MLWMVVAIKMVAETALLALVGRGLLLAWLARAAPGAPPRNNVFFWLLDTLSQPFVRAASWVTPRWVPPALWPLVAGCLLAFTWLAATLFKIQLCIEFGVQVCQ